VSIESQINNTASF